MLPNEYSKSRVREGEVLASRHSSIKRGAKHPVCYLAAAFAFGATRVRLTFCGRPAFTLCATPFIPAEDDALFDEASLPFRCVPFESTCQAPRIGAPAPIGTFAAAGVTNR
jgi:hypothetical protein